LAKHFLYFFYSFNSLIHANVVFISNKNKIDEWQIEWQTNYFSWQSSLINKTASPKLINLSGLKSKHKSTGQAYALYRAYWQVSNILLYVVRCAFNLKIWQVRDISLGWD
jgi:hypothetical protein